MKYKPATRKILTVADVAELQARQYRTAATSEPKPAIAPNEVFESVLQMLNLQALQLQPQPKPQPKAKPVLQPHLSHESDSKALLQALDRELAKLQRQQPQPQTKPAAQLNFGQRYELARNLMIERAKPNRGELTRNDATRRLVYAAERIGIETYLVPCYDEVMRHVMAGELPGEVWSGALIMRMGQFADIWIDYSQCEQLHRSTNWARLTLDHVVQAVICHEIGHVQINCEVFAGTRPKPSYEHEEWLAWERGEAVFLKHCGTYCQGRYRPPYVELHRAVKKAALGY